jgi:hypothetical protein
LNGRLDGPQGRSNFEKKINVVGEQYIKILAFYGPDLLLGMRQSDIGVFL